MKNAIFILSSSVVLLTAGASWAFEIPKECEEHALKYLNSYTNYYEHPIDSIESVTLGVPFKVGGISFRDLLKLEKDSDLLELPKHWTYIWTLFINGQMHATLSARDDCEASHMSENISVWCEIIEGILTDHPEFRSKDIYILSMHGPRHDLIIVDSGERKLVTSLHEVSLKICGVTEFNESGYTFVSIQDAVPYLLQAAKEDYRWEQEWRKATKQENGVLYK